jgi:CRISPR-associated protein Csb2
MAFYLCLSVGFLDGRFHGRRDGGAPEWPPSPLRLFQALVAAAAARWRDLMFNEYAVPALRWLEEQPAPVIATPASRTGQAYRLSVPNNAMDIVGRAWSRGNVSGTGDANPATHRAMKTVRPTHLAGDDAVCYLWKLPEPLTDEVRGFAEVLTSAARSVIALGWGVDMVAADGRVLSEEDVNGIRGEHWQPDGNATGNGLRVPRPGTLNGLVTRHQSFLSRLSSDGFVPVPSLSAYAVVDYRRPTDAIARPFAAFQLLKTDASGFRSFGTIRRTATVAGMVRHAAAAAAAAAGWPDDRVNTFIHGHTPDGSSPSRGDPNFPRFAYVPLPSIERRGPKGGRRTEHVGSIRRVLIAAPPGETAAVEWARRALSGQELIDEHTKQPVALLSLIPTTDPYIRDYVRESSVWSTVTPVVMPGHDDGNPAKAEKLLRKTLVQAGIPDELARYAEVEWRNVGFRAGVDLASRYTLPPPIQLPCYHVRIRWKNAHGQDVAINGPLAIGAGRYRGMGVFAAESVGSSRS